MSLGLMVSQSVVSKNKLSKNIGDIKNFAVLIASCNEEIR